MSKVFSPRSHHPLDASTSAGELLSSGRSGRRLFGSGRRLFGASGCSGWQRSQGWVAVLAVALALAAAACGDDERSAPPAATTSSTVTAATKGRGGGAAAPSPTTSGLTAGATSGSGAGESQPGGAGDESGGPVYEVRIESTRVVPRRLEVPPYLGVTVRVRSGDGRSHTVRLAGRNWSVPAAGEVVVALEGLRPGSKVVGSVDGDRTAFTVAAVSELER